MTTQCLACVSLPDTTFKVRLGMHVPPTAEDDQGCKRLKSQHVDTPKGNIKHGTTLHQQTVS